MLDTHAVTSSLSVSSIFANAIYVDDFDKAILFYTETLGMTRDAQNGSAGCFLGVGDKKHAIYLQGGFERRPTNSNACGVSFMLAVSDPHAAYEQIQASGAQMVQPAPMHVGNNSYWFQFFDPSGNLIEIVSMGSEAE